MPQLMVVLTLLLASGISALQAAPVTLSAQSMHTAVASVHPQSGDGDPTPPPPVAIVEHATLHLTPEQQRDVDSIHQYWHDMDRSLAASEDPRDWVLESSEMLEHDDRPDDSNPPAAELRVSGALLRKAAEAAPDDRLVQWIWARAQPWASGCSKESPCPGRTSALARLEPENAAAWEPVIKSALRASDMPAAEAGLAKMAAASRYDDRFVEAALAFRDIVRRYRMPPPAVSSAGDPEGEADEPTTAEALQDQDAESTASELTRGDPNGEIISPANLCRRRNNPHAPETRFRDCAQIGHLILGNATTVMSRLEGRWYLSASGMGTAIDRDNARTLAWQYWDAGDFPGAAKAPDFNTRIAQWFADVAETNDDVEALRRSLSRRGIPLTPPANWQPAHGPFGRTY